MFIMFSFDLVAKSPSASTRSFRATVFPLNIYEILKILFDPKKSWQHDSFEVEILLSECLREWRNFHFAKGKIFVIFLSLGLIFAPLLSDQDTIKMIKEIFEAKNEMDKLKGWKWICNFDTDLWPGHHKFGKSRCLCL